MAVRNWIKQVVSGISHFVMVAAMSDVTGARRGAQGSDAASRQIADALWSAIASGELKPGAKLPSERQLVETFDVARNTARAAVRLLVERGLVTVEHGRGVFVRARAEDLQLWFSEDWYTANPHTGSGDVAPQEGAAELLEVEVDRISPPPEVAELLGVRGDRKSVICRRAVCVVGGLRIERETAYIPWEIAKGTGLSRAGVLRPAARYALLEQAGYRTVRMREEISSRMPTPTEAVELGLPGGVPLLAVRHTGLDQVGAAFEVNERLIRADRCGLAYNVALSPRPSDPPSRPG